LLVGILSSQLTLDLSIEVASDVRNFFFRVFTETSGVHISSHEKFMFKKNNLFVINRFSKCTNQYFMKYKVKSFLQAVFYN